MNSAAGGVGAHTGVEAVAITSDAMCSGRDTCLFLVDPTPGADRPARAHLGAWLDEKGFGGTECHDVLVAVSEAVGSVVEQEREAGRNEPVQVSAVVETDDLGRRGVALRVVDQGTMPLRRGTVSTTVDYGAVMMRSAMEEVAMRSDPRGGTVITMRSRLRPGPGEGTAAS